MHSFVGMRLHDGRMPPAEKLNQKSIRNQRSFTSVQMCHTHTHPDKAGYLFRKNWKVPSCGARIGVNLQNIGFTGRQPAFSEVEREDCCRTWIASVKLMRSTILHWLPSSRMPQQPTMIPITAWPKWRWWAIVLVLPKVKPSP